MANYSRRWRHSFKGLSLNGVGRIFLKSLCNTSFTKDLSDEPTFGWTVPLTRCQHQKNTIISRNTNSTDASKSINTSNGKGASDRRIGFLIGAHRPMKMFYFLRIFDY